MQYGTVFNRKEGDHVNAVRYCFNVGSLDIEWFVHVMRDALYGRTTLEGIQKNKAKNVKKKTKRSQARGCVPPLSLGDRLVPSSSVPPRI